MSNSLGLVDETPVQIPYSSSTLEPAEFVTFPEGEVPLFEFPSEFRDRILIDTIHDGCIIPPEFLVDGRGEPIDDASFMREYISERDWGANLVAEHIAQYLGLPGYHRVNVARVLMDFGRFPGITHHNAEHLHRYAINYPFSELLSFQKKRLLLQDYYDQISKAFERQVRDKNIKIAIHTYDTHNASGTVRPPTSLVTRSVTYQARSEMPIGLFDPLYPDILAEFTADRLLRDRISLTLERANIPVAHNYPYCLPEGSIEVRSQVWFFFRYVRRRFEEAFPDSHKDPAFKRVWHMLTDTNLRDSESEALRSFLHMFRRPPIGFEKAYADARHAYEEVRRFMADGTIVRDYRFSRARPSSFGIEIRKDLLWEFDTDGKPVRPRIDQARRIARVIAEAISIYLNEDKPMQLSCQDTYLRTDPWYVGEPSAVAFGGE